MDVVKQLIKKMSQFYDFVWWCHLCDPKRRNTGIGSNKKIPEYVYLSDLNNQLSTNNVFHFISCSEEVNPVLRVSYMWYTLAGMLVSMCVGAIVSRINRTRGVPYVPPAPMLLAPQLRSLYKEPPHPSDEPYIRAYGQNKVGFTKDRL